VCGAYMSRYKVRVCVCVCVCKYVCLGGGVCVRVRHICLDIKCVCACVCVWAQMCVGSCGGVCVC